MARPCHAVCAALLALAHAIARGAPTAPDPLDKLKVYQGTWQTRTETFLTLHSKPGSETSRLQNDCWRSAGFYACRQSVDGESKALLVFTYDPLKNEYASYPIPVAGGPAGHGRLLIDGATWSFPWEQTEDATTTFYRVVNVFQGPRDIEFRSEYSSDNVHWTVMSKGHETKLSG